MAGLLLLGFVAIAAAAPVTVRPGDRSIDGRMIQTYQNKWKLVGRGSDSSVVEMGTWSDAARVDTIEGRDVVVRRQIWVHERGAEGYVNVFDRRTLAPIMSQYTNAGGLYRRIEFSRDGRTARYQCSPQPGPATGPKSFHTMTAGTVKTDGPLFDFNTGMFGLLIAGFPLTEGYAARFPVFRSYDPKPEPAWVDFEVKGRETVRAGLGTTKDTWLVVAHSPDTGEVMTFNLIQSPPYIIRLRQEWQGRDWTFEMM